MSTTVTKTLRVRIKDKHVALLRRMAKEVNTVWNYCNQANRDHWRKYHQHLTGYDLNKLTTGSSPAFQLVGDNTIQAVGQHYATKRRASGKSRLRWRRSNRNRRNYSLGWVPFKSRAATYKDGHLRFAGYNFHVWDSYGLGTQTVVKMVDFSHTLLSAISENAVCAAPPPQQFKTAPPGNLTREHRTGPCSSLPTGLRPQDSLNRIGSRVAASPAGVALQAPVSTAPEPHPSTSTRASLASLQVR